MHRLPNPHSVSRFNFVACLVLGNGLLAIGSLGLLVYSLVMDNADLIQLALILLGLVVLLRIIQWLSAARVRCPLCLGTPLSRNNCIKNRQARKWLGSYRLRVALSIFREGSFRCQYCGELTAIAVRQRHRRYRRDGGYGA